MEHEPINETYTLTMSNVTIGSTIPETITTTDLSGIGTIVDNNDSLPTISIDDIVANEGSVALFTVTLSNASQYGVTFQVDTSDGTAVGGSDYSIMSGEEFFIPAGNTSVVIPIAILDDNVYEPDDENYIVTISNAQIHSPVIQEITTTDLVGVGIITDNGDIAPTISIDDTIVEEGEIANFTVTLSATTQYDVTFEVTTEDGKAVEGEDYIAQKNINYTIPKGSITVTIPVTTVDDNLYESREDYILKLGNVSINSPVPEAIVLSDLEGSENVFDLDDDNDGIVSVVDTNYNDITAGGSVLPIDTDNDSVINSQDLDSDNDGIPDLIEGGTDRALDENNNGVIDNQTDTDGDGIVDVVDPDSGGSLATIPDTDTDGVVDYQDLDSDNDGISDLIEGGTDRSLDSESDGVLDTLIDDDGDGMLDAVDIYSQGVAVTVPDTDGDNTPDYQDVDADNDGISDVVEGNVDRAGSLDADNNGVLDEQMDTDGDGMFDVVDPDNAGITVTVPDTDLDGVPDYQDLDTDNDGLSDVVEGGGDDIDQNGQIDTNSLVDGTNLPDSDQDSVPDFRDIDIVACLTVYNEFTPNGDGENDTFIITCIEEDKYKNNRLEIYNRWGVMVYSKIRYDNSWTGTSTGRLTIGGDNKLPSGTYFYSLDAGDGSEPKVGWVYIHR